MISGLVAAVLLLQAPTTIDLEAAPGPLNNPGKGLVLPANSTAAVANTLELREYLLSEVLVGPDEYDFSQIDDDLDDSFDRGKRVVLRIRSAKAGRADAIPEHFGELAETNVSLLDVAPNVSSQPIRSPDFGNPSVVIELVKFVYALGNEFDEDLRIAFIVDGLLGRGVDVSKSVPAEFQAPPETVAEVAKAYDEAFDVTQVLMNDPLAAKEAAVGLFDDQFAAMTLDYELEEYEDSFLGRLREQSMEEIGNYRPVGGVLASSIQGKAWLPSTLESAGVIFAPSPTAGSSQGVAEAIEGAHATFVITPYLPSPLDEATRNRIESAIRKMGYQFRVTRVVVQPQTDHYDITFDVLNEGSAPILIPAGILMALIDEDGVVFPGFQFMGRSLIGLEPGETSQETFSVLRAWIEDQGSTVAIGIIADESETPSIRFANANQDLHAEGWLTLLDLDVLNTVRRR
jgi:hypothetical protein